MPKIPILLAEDHSKSRHDLALILDRSGYQVFSVPDGEEAWNFIRDNTKDEPLIALLDLKMPRMSGFEVVPRIAELQKREPDRFIFTITLSGKYRSAGDRALLLNLGVSAHLSKPFNLQELFAYLDKAHTALESKLRREEAVPDKLTGFYNREFGMKKLEKELDFASKHGGNITFAFIDLDEFKKINDLHGHDVGDQVLRYAALRLAQHARDMDTVIRLGGDEFGIVFRGMDVRAAEHKGAEIVSDLSNSPIGIRGSGLSIPLTVSVGMAVNTTPPFLSAEKLIKQADEAMYEAKAHGRNHFRVRNVNGDNLSVFPRKAS